jgi:DNA-binding transcriptional LysR family regulator
MATSRNIDLHALECFDALLRERNVSRAAERVGLSQSAMSDVLAKLRDRFHDPLLVKGRTGMVPTPRAEALVPLVRDTLDRLVSLADSTLAFDPALCEQRFRLATSDYTQLLLLPQLVTGLAKLAPAAAVDVLPVGITQLETALEAAEIDLAVAYFHDPPAGLRRLPLLTEHSVLIARRDHPQVSVGMTNSGFAELLHVTVSPSGLGWLTAYVDEALAPLGVSRKIRVSTPHFLLAAYLVSVTDLVLVIPSHAGAHLAELFPLTVVPLPFADKELQLSMFWHERTHKSAAHQWFRSRVQEVLVSEP